MVVENSFNNFIVGTSLKNIKALLPSQYNSDCVKSKTSGSRGSFGVPSL